MYKVMVVDDSFVMRNNLKRLLEQSNYKIVSEAENGREAVVEYFKHRPDIVTMDLNMPVMDGIEAVKKIIQKDPLAKIVIISAFNQRLKILEALENGAKHYVTKPITQKKINDTIQAVIELEDRAVNNKEN